MGTSHLRVGRSSCARDGDQGGIHGGGDEEHGQRNAESGDAGAPNRIAQEKHRHGQQADPLVEQPFSDEKDHDAREKREQMGERNHHPLLGRKHAAGVVARERDARRLESGGQHQGPQRRVQGVRMPVDHRAVLGRFFDQAPHGEGPDALRDELVFRGQVAAQLAVVHGFGLLEAVELRGRVKEHEDQDAEAVQPGLDQPQADADIDIVNEVLDLRFKRFGHDDPFFVRFGILWADSARRNVEHRTPNAQRRTGPHFSVPRFPSARTHSASCEASAG